MSSEIVFKVPIDGFQYLRRDGANYNVIASGKTHKVIENREMFITDDLEVIGTLDIVGEVEVYNGFRVEIDANATAIATNAADIATNTSDIATNTSDLSALETKVVVNPSNHACIVRFSGSVGNLQNTNILVGNDDSIYFRTDNTGSYFGAGFDSSIIYDGTNMVYNSQLVGSGKHEFLGGAIIPVAGAFNNCSIQSPNEAGTGLYFPSANKMYLNCGGVTGGLFFGTKSAGNFSNFGVGVASTNDKYPFAIQRNHDNTCIFNIANTSDGSNSAVYQDIQCGSTTTVAMRFGAYSVASSGITQQNAAITTYNKANNLVFIAAGTAMNNSIRFYCGGIAGSDQTMELYANQTTETKGGIIRANETITAASDTLDEGNHFVFCDTTSNAITINLPAAASHNGREYFIKCINAANSVTVDGNASETIDGDLTQTINFPDTMKIISDGTEWRIV